jgi:type IV/VI secretion system ImpK/VasF family protein
MASTIGLWFEIETAFSDIERVCVEARASALVHRRSEQEANALRAMMSGRTAPMEEDPATAGGDPRQARAIELARDATFAEANASGPDLVELRSRLRKRIGWLKGKLAEALTEHEVYYALFPIVVYADELVATVMPGMMARWEPLQGELYDVDNGGELFYSILEDRFRKEETPPVVFEVFYFCLSDGFLGMYASDRAKIAEYRARLKDKIPLRPTESADLGPREPRGIELVKFPWRYYAVAVAAIVGGWLLLSLIAALTSGS